jgi:excinuclease UvrABC nuclease subunit
LGAGAWTSSDSVLESISQPEWVDAAEEVLAGNVGDSETERLIEKLEKEMKAAAARLDFERAADIRDRISELQYTTN